MTTRAAGSRLRAYGAQLVLALSLAVGCGAGTKKAVPTGDGDRALAPLRAYEEGRRVSTDFAHLPPSDRVMGADPYAVVALPGGRTLGLLRGDAALVVLDQDLVERQRLPTFEEPTALAIDADGRVFVVSERASTIARFHWDEGSKSLLADSPLSLEGVLGARGIAVGPEGALHVVEEHDGRLLTFVPVALEYTRSESFVGHGALRVVRTKSFVVTLALLDHDLVVRHVDAHGVPLTAGESRLHTDGPCWGIAASEASDGVLTVVAGGVEDHPLDRTGGFFGYVDSFFYAYRVTSAGAERTLALNLSESFVVTPKALVLAVDKAADKIGENGFVADVVGYGGEKRARIHFGVGTPKLETASFPPGGTALLVRDDGALAVANPLLDAFVLEKTDKTEKPAAPRVVPVGTPPRDVESRLGEALFFTSLMAPDNVSEGAHSRFTCETCHFEGHVDGRTHHTGRGEVHATTKPLLGLFNNRPHFTRALDPDLTTVAHNEFRVAGAGSGHDPWFTLTAADHAWVKSLGVTSETVPPTTLRRSLMSFLIDFTPRQNPAVAGRTKLTTSEQHGAELFRDRCESCHSARLSTDDASTHVAFEKWESLLFSTSSPLVWASPEYQKTGVMPYVHDKGARTPSLRRLFRKYPYFTNGSAKSLDDVLLRARFGDDGTFLHAGGEGDAQLQPLPPLHALQNDGRRDLRAFLELL